MTTNPMPPSLKQRVFRAGAWVVIGHGVGQAIRLGSSLIMTRLLVPEMFGMMAVAWIVMTGLQLLSDMGIRQSIVQSRRGDDPVFLGTAWATQILRGGILWLLGLVVAGSMYLAQLLQLMPPGTVYADPLLPTVISVLAAAAFITGFESTRIGQAERILAQARLAWLDIFSQLTGVACMIAWAFIDRSIWALVAGGLITAMMRTIFSHVWLPGGQDRWIWDRQAFRELVDFGKWIFLTSILGFLAVNGDRLILGGLSDQKTLGLYAIAFLMVNALQDVINKLISSIAFSALSEVVRERSAALKRVYYKIRLPVDMATLSLSGLLFSAGHLLIDVLYDERYMAAGHMVEILSISLIALRFSLANQCFMAMGKPKLMVPIILVRIIALFGLMPAVHAVWGLDGALWIAGSSILFSLPIIFYFKIRFGLFDLRRELAVLPFWLLGYGLGLLLENGIQYLRLGV